MSDRFNADVRHVLGAANRLAARLRHTEVRSEHVLGALLSEGQGRAFDIFKAVGLSPNQLMVKVDQMLAARRHDRATGQLPHLAQQTKQIVLDADRESQRLRHSEVGTEHLLIALAMNSDSTPAHLLAQHGLTLAKCRYTLNQISGTIPTVTP